MKVVFSHHAIKALILIDVVKKTFSLTTVLHYPLPHLTNGKTVWFFNALLISQRDVLLTGGHSCYSPSGGNSTSMF